MLQICLKIEDWCLSQGKMECFKISFSDLWGAIIKNYEAKARAIGAWGVIAPTFLGLSHQQISLFRNPSNPYSTVGWHTTNENRKGTRSWSRLQAEKLGKYSKSNASTCWKTEHDGGNQRAKSLSHTTWNFATSTLYTPGLLSFLS